jgi:hypoxanthine phosphoribosyltransferase
LRRLHGRLLLDRDSAREAIEPTELRVDVPLKYKAVDIPGVFVIEYGLDYAKRYRNLPFVATPAVRGLRL